MNIAKQWRLLLSCSVYFVTRVPLTTEWIQKNLSNIGRAAGFADPVVSYCPQRGAAYALSVGTSNENL